MNTIRDAHFRFDLDISGEQASSISRRALEILQERLDAAPLPARTIEDLEVKPIELPRAEISAEDTAHRIAGAVYSSIQHQTPRGNRG